MDVISQVVDLIRVSPGSPVQLVDLEKESNANSKSKNEGALDAGLDVYRPPKGCTGHIQVLHNAMPEVMLSWLQQKNLDAMVSFKKETGFVESKQTQVEKTSARSTWESGEMLLSHYEVHVFWLLLSNVSLHSCYMADIPGSGLEIPVALEAEVFLRQA